MSNWKAAPALLTPEELAEIKRTANNAYEGRITTCDLANAYTDDVNNLLAHAAALTARAEKAEARVKEQTAELAEQEVAKLDMVKENQGQRAMIGALDLIRAGYMEKCDQITRILLTFPEYAQAEKHLLEAKRVAPTAPCLSDCQAGRDGDCIAAGCPQLRDNEPERSGRSCPIYSDEDND